MMRRALDALYAFSGGLAALFLALIFGIIIVQVIFNAIDRVAGLVLGQAFGLAIPSYADFAGFFLASTSFLGLAATLRSGDLIRVNLLLQRTGPRIRRIAEIWATAIGSVIAAMGTYYSVHLAMDAWRYNELSTGIIAVPMWIPQLSLILGLAILTVAFIDSFVACVRHGTIIETKSELETEAASGTAKEGIAS